MTPLFAPAHEGRPRGGLDVRAVENYLRQRVGIDVSIVDVQLLGRGSDQANKQFGYGGAVRVRYAARGHEDDIVIHTMKADQFGHDRLADRVGAMMLAYDVYNRIPRHVRALDIGAFTADGSFRSWTIGEPFLVTTYTPGALYAEDVARLANASQAADRDLSRARALAEYLADLHGVSSNPAAHLRALRDTVGHGEGILGLIDSFDASDVVATPERLRKIEEQVLEWRWKLKEKGRRAVRIHGDFHPFNIVFREDSDFTVLDSSRGGVGDPADDLTCLTINYLFSAALSEQGFVGALREVWDAFWETYRAHTSDPALLDAVPVFFTWRALVLASPIWYGHTPTRVRDMLLRCAERLLGGIRFEPNRVEEVWS